MTYKQAVALLPSFARGLVQNVSTVTALRAAVMGELVLYDTGSNPLTGRQVVSLQAFMRATA